MSAVSERRVEFKGYDCDWSGECGLVPGGVTCMPTWNQSPDENIWPAFITKSASWKKVRREIRAMRCMKRKFLFSSSDSWTLVSSTSLLVLSHDLHLMTHFFVYTLNYLRRKDYLVLMNTLYYIVIYDITSKTRTTCKNIHIHDQPTERHLASRFADQTLKVSWATSGGSLGWITAVTWKECRRMSSATWGVKHSPGVKRVVEQKVSLVDFSVSGIDGDDRESDLVGPCVHHLGDIHVASVFIHSLEPSCVTGQLGVGGFFK